jgi:hypothetical protein
MSAPRVPHSVRVSRHGSSAGRSTSRQPGNFRWSPAVCNHQPLVVAPAGGTTGTLPAWRCFRRPDQVRSALPIRRTLPLRWRRSPAHTDRNRASTATRPTYVPQNRGPLSGAALRRGRGAAAGAHREDLGGAAQGVPRPAGAGTPRGRACHWRSRSARRWCGPRRTTAQGARTPPPGTLRPVGMGGLRASDGHPKSACIPGGMARLSHILPSTSACSDAS